MRQRSPLEPVTFGAPWRYGDRRRTDGDACPHPRQGGRTDAAGRLRPWTAILMWPRCVSTLPAFLLAVQGRATRPEKGVMYG